MTFKDMDEPLSLEQWAAGERVMLESFVAHWKHRRTEEPEHFPPMLNSGEWDEQFRAYTE
jgi:hypothetical protein